MGNSQNINQEIFKDEQLRQFQQNTKFLKQIFDSSFGDITLYQRITSDDEYSLIAQKSRIIEDKDKFVEYFKKADQRLQVNKDNLLNLVGYKFQQSTEICGSQNITHLYYEYYEHNLDKEINARQKKTEHFSEPELWYLIKCLCSICFFLQQQHTYHGDIKPQNIYITNQGIIKIADHNFTNQHKSGYLKTLIGVDNSYLSPLLMKAFSEKLSEPKHNEYKSDMYSFGLTVLESATLISAQTVYDWQDGSISVNQIDDLLQRVQQRYSQQFLTILKIMLQQEEDNRPDFEELNLLLQTQQFKDIYASKNFSIIQNLFSPTKPTYESFRNTTESPFSIKSNSVKSHSPSLMNVLTQSPAQLQEFIPEQNDKLAQIQNDQQKQSQFIRQSPAQIQQVYDDNPSLVQEQVMNKYETGQSGIPQHRQLIYYHNAGQQPKKPIQVPLPTQKTSYFLKKQPQANYPQSQCKKNYF